MQQLSLEEFSGTDTYDCPDCPRSFETENGLRSHHGHMHDGTVSKEAVECANCGAEKQVKPSVAERFERHFCDNPCQAAWWEENRTGSRNPAYQGGGSCRLDDVIRRRLGPRGWTIIAKEFRQSSDGVCEMCGAEPDGRALDVHHIVSVRCGGSNHKENLMLLCRRCHATVDKYTRDLLDGVLVKDEFIDMQSSTADGGEPSRRSDEDQNGS